MRYVTTLDGTSLSYRDWGTGRPVVLSHGWPLSGDAWDDVMFALASSGLRAIAHDRRGHGRSDQPWAGNDMNTWADDLAELVDALDLHDAVLVGHSTGGGEVVRYLARHGTGRVAKVVLVGAVTPLLLRGGSNPDGIDAHHFDELRASLLFDRSTFYRRLALVFYGTDRLDPNVSHDVRDQFWRLAMQVGLRAAHAGIDALSATDFRAELAELDLPVLVAHGDRDQLCPLDLSGRRTAALVRRARLVVYPGAPHGLTGAYQAAFAADLVHYARE